MSDEYVIAEAIIVLTYAEGGIGFEYNNGSVLIPFIPLPEGIFAEGDRVELLVRKSQTSQPKETKT
jgi:hypothetical protein